MAAKTKTRTQATQALGFVNNLTHTGDFSGEPFVLRKWQEQIIRGVFATRPDGLRKHRRVFLALPRKQGKTELAAAVAVFLLLGQGKRGQRIYSASGDHKQAALIFHAAASMIRNDPELDRYCHIYDGYKRIEVPALDCTYEALSSESGTKHGLGPSAVIFDELHVLPNRELFNVLTTGFAARREPLTIMITTAGYDRTSLCWEQWDYARKVRDGVIDDATFLPILYEAKPEDDWTDEKVWRKAMPALGDFCSLEFIRDECKRAKELPAYENTFRQLYLNQWTEQAERWLSVETWNACGTLDLAEVEGRACYAGLDLGVTGDMSALALVFPNDETGGYDVDARFWVPRDGKWRREQRNAELYPLWEKQGFLKFTDGEVTDFDQVETDILESNKRYPFIGLFADRAYASHLLSRLLNRFDMNVRGIPQGPITLNEPMVKLEACILDKTLRHARNPVLAWNVANAVMKRGTTGLMHLDKSSAYNRIDGLAAVVNALRAGIDNDSDRGQSVYEDGELFVL